MPISLDALLSKERMTHWHAYGLRQNPFPPSGVVLDVEHDRPTVSLPINSWLTETVDPAARMFAPLVIHGDIGVGKTHFLTRIGKVVEAYSQATRKSGKAGWGVHQIALPEAGLGKLELSRLLLGVVQTTAGDVLSTGLSVPIVGAITKLLRGYPDPASVIAETLPAGSALAPVFRQVIAPPQQSERDWKADIVGRWLLRNTPTPPQRSAASLPGPLVGEGQAVAAYCDVLRLARRVGIISGSLFLLDQVEDLWRRSAVSPMRRARFLTDLRGLVDQSLTGAPVAVVLAWNTYAQGESQSTSALFEHDYAALWGRLSRRVEVTALPVTEIRSFAQAFVRYEEQQCLLQLAGANAQATLVDHLSSNAIQSLADTAQRLQPAGKGLVIQRKILDALRDWANEVVEAT